MSAFCQIRCQFHIRHYFHSTVAKEAMYIANGACQVIPFESIGFYTLTTHGIWFFMLQGSKKWEMKLGPMLHGDEILLRLYCTCRNTNPYSSHLKHTHTRTDTHTHARTHTHAHTSQKRQDMTTCCSKITWLIIIPSMLELHIKNIVLSHNSQLCQGTRSVNTPLSVMNFDCKYLWNLLSVTQTKSPSHPMVTPASSTYIHTSVIVVISFLAHSLVAG